MHADFLTGTHVFFGVENSPDGLICQQEFAYTYPGFETDTYTSSGLHDYVVIAMDNILNNGADVRTELENLISTLQ